jgi:hypothetical protein
MKEHLPWLVPLLISIMIGFANLYSLQEKVEEIHKIQQEQGIEAIKKVDYLEYRVGTLEKFCCSEIEEKNETRIKK